MTNVKDTDKGINWSFWVVLTFLIGLLFFSYPPLKILSNSTRIFRPDWALSIPLFAYVLINRPQVELKKPVLFAVLFIIVAAISVFVNPMRSPFDFLTAFLQIVFAVGVLIALTSIRLDRNTFINILRVWMVILTAISIYTIYEMIAINIGLPLSTLYPREFDRFPVLADYYRPHVIFSEPSFLATHLVTGIAILFPCVAKSEAILFSKWFQGGIFALLTAGVITSLALSGYLTIAVLLVILVLVPELRRTILPIWLFFGGLAIVAFVMTMFLAPTITEKMLGRFESIISVLSAAAAGNLIAPRGSIGARWVRLLSGLEALVRQPLFGVGLGQFDQWVSDISFKYVPSDDRLGNLQGGYIHVIAQTGLVGIVTFSLIWIHVVREAVHSVAVSDGIDQTLALVCTCVILTTLVGWVHSYTIHHTVRWGLIGICYGYISTNS